MNKILIVEDDNTIGESLLYLLNNENFEVNLNDNSKDAIENIKANHFDLLIIDLCLPDSNGFTLYEEIKTIKNIPTIFLTALDDEINIVRGLELGAYDYITKPFKVRELITRIKNIITRTTLNNDIIIINNVKINIKSGKVTKNDSDVFLTALEYKILLILATNKNNVLTREYILANIWDCNEEYVNDNTLTVYIKRLREKLEDNINKPKIILTVRNIGYKIDI